MSFIFNLVLAVQLIAAIGVIGLVLVQQGKGADMGAAFGSGNSGSLFGASGSANFLSRTTAVLATVFFVCTLGLAYLGSQRPADSGSVLERAGVTVPAAPASAAVEQGTAAQIPGAGSAAPAAPATPAAAPASGAGQIPAKR